MPQTNLLNRELSETTISSSALKKADASRSSTGGVKARDRVAQHGEVFTPDWVVSEMLDMLPSGEHGDVWTAEEDKKQKTFLEPACGEGAFLMEILLRKLQRTTERYSHDQDQWEWQAILAVSSLYGIELLEDNSERCIMNLYELFLEQYYDRQFPSKNRDSLAAIKFIISRNIMQGDFLTQKQRDGNPIIVSDFTPIVTSDGSRMLQRKDYELSELVRKKSNEGTIFSLLTDDPGIVAEYKPVPWRLIESAEVISGEETHESESGEAHA